MQKYLDGTSSKQKTDDDPLFFSMDGLRARLRENTPPHRLQHCLKLIGMTDVSEYGFHSLRAGGATVAAKAGVAEQHIKAHGNWKSNAVQVYIRPGVEERLIASSALGT
jgi:hypothetical protein